MDFITAKVKATTELNAREKKTRLAKFDAAIAKVAAELREADKAAALAEIEEQYAGEAA